MKEQPDKMAGTILSAVGMALSPLVTGKTPKLPRVPVKLRSCPFCGRRARMAGPFPMIGCSNMKCPVRPAVKSAQLMLEGVDLYSREGVRRMADLWNRRAP